MSGEGEPARWWYRDQWWVRKELSWDIGTFTVVYCPERDKVFCTGSFESHTRKYWILRSARTFECSDGVTRIESGEVLPPKDGQWFAQRGVPKKAHRFYEPSFSYPILVPVEDTEPATDGEKGASGPDVADAHLAKWTIDEMREALEHIARHPQECPHAKKGFEQQAKCSLCMAATARNALDRIEEANEIQPEAKASEVSENDLVVSSAPGVHGKVSPRRYTKAEVSAAKRLGFAHGNLSDAGGPIFWATGDHYPSLIREQLNDYLLVAAAIEREWEGDER